MSSPATTRPRTSGAGSSQIAALTMCGRGAAATLARVFCPPANERSPVPERPIIVFDVNETLLDLEAIRPTFDRIFNDPAAMRLWFEGPGAAGSVRNSGLPGAVGRPDELELRGPIGRWFVWDPIEGGPLLLVAGGSGIVPLRALLRHRQRSGSDAPVRLLYSSRTLADVIYHRELDQHRDGTEVSYTQTRSQPPGWTGYSGRVDAAMLAKIAWPTSQHPLAFVCGPTRFVETVAGNLVALGYPAGRVKTERFGGT